MKNPKRQKTCELNYKKPKLPALSIESLPNEIFMNFFSNLNIKDLLKCGQVNKKFRQISHDKSFWKCVNLYNQNVSCELIGHILSLGTEYRGSPLSTNSLSTIPEVVRFINSTKSAISLK